MIQRLRIKQFKSVADFDQTLKPVSILVGANNSGKTSVLNAVHSAVAVAQSRLRLQDQIPMVPGTGAARADFTISVQDMLYLPLVDPGWLATNGRFTQTNGPEIRINFTGSAAEGLVKIVRGKNRNLSVDLEGNEVISRIEQIAKPFSIYVPGLAGIAKNETFISRGSLLRAVARGDANLVLRNVLYVLRRTKKTEAEKVADRSAGKAPTKDQWTPFAAALTEVFPDREIEVDFNPEVDEFIKVSVKFSETTRIPLDCIGTGFLQTIQILSYLFLFEPDVLLLDEPDSHLHPNNQRLLAQLLFRLTSSGTMRLIMATHSRHIIDTLRHHDEVSVIWMRNGSVERSNEHIEVLSDLGAFDNAERLLATRIQYAILTEDEDYSMLKTVLISSGLDPSRFQIWAYKGCTKLDVAEALARFINFVSPHTKILLYRDSDYLNDDYKAHLRAQFDRINVKAFFPPGVDMESLFCRPAHLQHLNPANALLVPGIVTNAIRDLNDDLVRSATKGWDVSNKLNFDSGIATGGAEAKSAWLTALTFNNEKWVKGKLLLPFLKTRFKTDTGNTLIFEPPSEHLQFTELTNLLAALALPAPSPTPIIAAVAAATPNLADPAHVALAVPALAAPAPLVSGVAAEIDSAPTPPTSAS